MSEKLNRAIKKKKEYKAKQNEPCMGYISLRHTRTDRWQGLMRAKLAVVSELQNDNWSLSQQV